MCLYFSGLIISEQEPDRDDYGNTAQGCDLNFISVRYLLAERIADYINATYYYG
jgi:hypothetical protein